MAKLSKNMSKAYQLVDVNSVYGLDKAIELLKKAKYAKFDETVDLAINLGVDPRHADQNIRGAAVMPHGLGKKVVIIAFCQGENLTLAKQAGADFVGGEDLVEKILKENWMDFDNVVATPDMMKVVSKLGKVLGPRGLMPNPKTGTVTQNVAQAIKELKAGKAQFKVDKKGVLHCPVGKLSFDTPKLMENVEALIDMLKKLKPTSAKGAYFKKMTISSTMGPGVKVDVSEIA